MGTSLSGHGAGTALVSLVAEGGLQVTLLLSLHSHKALPRTVIIRPPLRAAQSGPAGRLCGSGTWLGKLVLASLQAPQIWGGSPPLGFGDGKDPPPAPQEVGNSLSPCEQALWRRVWPS